MIWDATREEIELVCAYIRDDQTVANYFGIDHRRVEHIRATMKESKEKLLPTCYGYGDGTRNGSSGLTAHLAYEEDSERGSRLLWERIENLFSKWERAHGFRAGAGKILLPAGYCPERAAA